MGDSINVMSVYHPFPVRIDTAGAIGSGTNNCINLVKGSACPPGCISLNGTGKANDIGNCQPLNTNIQYDACFQVGEFPSHAIPGIVEAKAGNSIVILVPLKADASATGDGARFVNAFGSQIPNILGSQPDPLQGYPDVPASTGANWSLSAIVKSNRPFYTWITTYDSTLSPPQTRVVVMSEPVLIAQTDLTNIQRLPITDPDDVIHEITAVSYRAAPPLVGCAPAPGSSSSGSSSSGSSSSGSSSSGSSSSGSSSSGSSSSGPSPELLGEIFGGIIGGIILLIAIYFGLRWAMSGTGDWFAGLGERIAGALRPARSALANTLNIGASSRRPPPRPEAASSDSTFTGVNPMHQSPSLGNNPRAQRIRGILDQRRLLRERGSADHPVPASGVGPLNRVTQRPAAPGTPADAVSRASRRNGSLTLRNVTSRTEGTTPRQRAARGTGIQQQDLSRVLGIQNALGHTLDNSASRPPPGSAAAIVKGVDQQPASNLTQGQPNALTRARRLIDAATTRVLQASRTASRPASRSANNSTQGQPNALTQASQTGRRPASRSDDVTYYKNPMFRKKYDEDGVEVPRGSTLTADERLDRRWRPPPPPETTEERIERRAKETSLAPMTLSADLASRIDQNKLIGKGRRRKNRRYLRTGRRV